MSLGEIIGRVGSSGLSTGPHLHFALERDGHYVNPLTESIGVNHQVSPRMRSLFDQFKDNYLAMLSKLPDLGGHFHVGAAVSSVAQATGQAATHLAGEQGSHRRVASSMAFLAHLDGSLILRAAVARSALDSDFFDLPIPRVIAHRGASGEYPENTLVAFRAAAEAGAPYFELDVHMTRDGVVVVSHDPELSRTCGLDAAIRDLTLAELKRADAGWGFTTARPPRRRYGDRRRRRVSVSRPRNRSAGAGRGFRGVSRAPLRRRGQAERAEPR